MIDTVIRKYFPVGKAFSVKPYGDGHINDTYKLDIERDSYSYILQRINSSVFKDPELIIKNHYKLQKSLFEESQPISIAKLVGNKAGNYFFVDDEGFAWRVTEFINNTYTVNVIEEDWQAYQAGVGYGGFAKVCSGLNVNDFGEAIKDFHSLKFRIGQLNDAIEEDASDRCKSVESVIDFYKEREGFLQKIEELIETGDIPLRVVHNDTKINNILFRDQEAVAVIDLDTVGPGSILYDYGDALRTSANTANEDERILERVSLNLDSFRLFTEGYLLQVKGILTDAEKKYLNKAPILMTFIMGIRFLTDFINGDVYYKTTYPEHNLDRSKVQMELIKSMEQNEEFMKDTIEGCLKR